MNTKMNISDALLFLELIKREKKQPSLEQLYMMVCSLEDYEQVKDFNNKINELKLKPQIKFYKNLLIHFIEDYDDCVNMKNNILQRTKMKHKMSSVFIHLIQLCESKEQAVNIKDEARDYGIHIDDSWTDKFNSLWMIKKYQKGLRDSIIKNSDFSKMQQEYYEMKTGYFSGLSLKQLKRFIMEMQPKSNDSRKTGQVSVFSRNIFVKEFAKKVASGVCQLCNNNAPFLDIQGNPFLEVHHIHYLSKGGNDTIENVVALCPNCHRKIHQLELQEDVIEITEKARKNLTI